jgi:5-methylcytosine-specific restriction endonuclease McrA
MPKGIYIRTKQKGKTGEKSNHWKGGKIEKVCLFCGTKFYVYPYLKEQKFCSYECYWKSQHKRGEDSQNWKGGLTPKDKLIRNSIEFRLWREAVFARDNYTCQVCDQYGGNLNAHHINNFAEFPELRFAIDNGITLCEKCHKEFHKKYGIKNNTKEQLEEFIKERRQIDD